MAAPISKKSLFTKPLPLGTQSEALLRYHPLIATTVLRLLTFAVGQTSLAF